MKGIKANFIKKKYRNPFLSDITLLTQIIVTGDFKRRAIRTNFNELVDPDDYHVDDYQAVLEYLYLFSKTH